MPLCTLRGVGLISNLQVEAKPPFERLEVRSSRWVPSNLLQLFFSQALVVGVAWGQYRDPHCPNRSVIVHLFEWKWEDVARECEDFLGPQGYCGVQVSPVNEHVLYTWGPVRPWWEVYQPVSYQLASRGGNPEQLRDMVDRCNKVGVRVYVDAVLNHMASINQQGNGTAGSFYDSDLLEFPAVPYTARHFHSRQQCPSLSGSIANWSDPVSIRNCRLLELSDLDQSQQYVRDKQVQFLNSLVDLGVAGFRLDASKHMWPADLEAIMSRVHDVTWGGRPFFCHEVIDRGNDVVSADEYRHLGYVTEFRYCGHVAEGIRDFRRLRKAYDPSIGMLDTEHALVFVDNHDNQRDGGGEVVTHKTPREYKMAQVFTLAYGYGMARVMSSYSFTDRDEGPPHYDDYTTSNVTTLADGSCGGGWVCEHRWPPLAKMARFRSAMAGSDVRYWQDAEAYVAFARGARGFFAMARSGGLDRWFMTGLPGGYYCDVISDCSVVVRVGANGRARIKIENDDEPYLAIWTGGPQPSPSQRVCRNDDMMNPLPKLFTPMARTVVLIRRQTTFGENVFIRGGISHTRREGCTSNAETSACAISIRHRMMRPASFVAWSKGDNHLDWYGREREQPQDAAGTPVVWTTNDVTNDNYNPLNTLDKHYWLMDVDMDCASTVDGWFEFKAVVNSKWEPDIHQEGCQGTSARAPYSSTNHMARCGYVNIFQWGESACEIRDMPQ